MNWVQVHLLAAPALVCGVWFGGFKFDDLHAGPNGCVLFALCVF